MTIWKYSRRDAALLLITTAQMALSIWLAATWDERPLLQLFLLWPIAVLLFWYNGSVAAHNFLHTPWFKHDLLNTIYAALNSINIGVPLTLCRFHHLNHHAYGNDRPGEDGRTGDHSSTYAFGRDGRHESVLSYCALGLFRGGIAEAYSAVRRSNRWNAFCRELAVCALGLAAYALLSWRYALFFHLPVFYVGSVLGIMNNYYQHFGAEPEKHSANSVSYYGRFYNFLLCNEGYHQEHHLKPQMHWTRRPEVRQALGSAQHPVSSRPPLLRLLARR